MKKKSIFLAVTLCFAVLALSGVTLAEDKKCIDCHYPETRDHDYTRLKVTTRMIQAHGPAAAHGLDECGKCHSEEYIFAPEGSKPKTWDQISTGITCVVCHPDHTKGEKPGERKRPTCEECHSVVARGIALDMPFVYNPQSEFFRGFAPDFLEIKGVPNRWKSKKCEDCHMPNLGGERRGHTFLATMPGSREFTCGQAGCHVGKGEAYTDLARGWQREIERGLREAKAQLNNKRPLTVTNKDNQKRLQIAKFELDFVANDLSYGVHNIDYARFLIAEAKRQLSQIK